jgi:hypothetical protein
MQRTEKYKRMVFIMLGKRFCGYKNDGTQLMLSDEEIIKNALDQEKDGVKPHYAFYDWKNKKAVTPCLMAGAV